jgi:hypothetical protein
MKVSLKRSLYTSPEPMASWRMFSLERTAPLKRFKSIHTYLNNSMMFFPGLTRKCQASIQESSNMR